MIAVITDPLFYAVAVPAVLLAGVSKSGFLSGFGSLSVPLMALVIPVPQAAAVMLPLLMAMDAAGIQQLWRQRDPALVRLLLPFGLLGVLVGALLFGVLSQKATSGVIGALTLSFLAQRLLFPPKRDAPRAPDWVGRLCATASGFTSFVAHAGSPPLGVYVLPLRLAPLVLSGTLAVFFAVINAAKWVPYLALGLIDARNLGTSLVLLPLAPLGVWLGVKATGRISPARFYQLAYTGMFLAGAKLLYDGLR